MLRLDHVVFPVTDAGRSLVFYRDVLGLPLVRAIDGEDWGGRPWLMMIFGLPGGGEIVLVELQDAPSPDYSGLPADVRHYALATSSQADLEAWRDRLAAAHVAFWEEGHGDQQSLYFPDPDGVILEITAPPSRPDAATTAAALQAVEHWLAARSPTPA